VGSRDTGADYDWYCTLATAPRKEAECSARRTQRIFIAYEVKEFDSFGRLSSPTPPQANISYLAQDRARSLVGVGGEGKCVPGSILSWKSTGQLNDSEFHQTMLHSF
jgi:hypothetical protein